MRYALGLDPDVLLLGMSTAAEVEEALAAARAFAPMTAAERADCERDAGAILAGKGRRPWQLPGSAR